jgi:NitT/TauT family transport system substrate-binding protein
MRKRFSLFGIVITVVVLIAACSRKAQYPLPILRVGHAPHDHHSALYVAAMNPEYFKEHGSVYLKMITFRKEYKLISGGRPIARVLIDSSTGGRRLIRKLAEQHLDISFGGFPAMLTFIDQGFPIRILAPAMEEGAGLMVHKDLPARNWAEFVAYVRQREHPLRIGYKIAVSVQNLIFEGALRESGINYSSELDDPSAKISLINLYGAKNLIPAMENCLIDGFVIMQPFLALAEERGTGKVVAFLNDLPPEGRWRGYPCCALAGNDAYVQSYPAVVESMVTLMLRANRFIVEHPKKSAAQIAQWLDLSPKVEELSIPTIKFTVEFDESWNRGVNFWIESMIEVGMLNKKVKDAYKTGNLRQIIYNQEVYAKARGNM